MKTSNTVQAEIETFVATIAAEWVTLRRGGGEFRVTGKPDHTERSAPAVDLQGHDDAGEIFVEHTQIEPMENRIRTSHTLRTMFPKGGVPVDDPIGNRFFLVFDISDLARVKSPVAAAAELHEWVRQCFADGSAQDLAITNEIAFAASGRPQGSLGAVLRRWDLPIRSVDGNGLVRLHVAAEGGKTYASIGRSLGRKIPKLLSAAGEVATSVLVFEDAEWSAGPNPRAVAEATHRYVVDGGTLPDFVVLIGTAFGHLLGWMLWDSAAGMFFPRTNEWFYQWPNETQQLFRPLHHARVESAAVDSSIR